MGARRGVRRAAQHRREAMAHLVDDQVGEKSGQSYCLNLFMLLLLTLARPLLPLHPACATIIAPLPALYRTDADAPLVFVVDTNEMTTQVVLAGERAIAVHMMANERLLAIRIMRLGVSF